MRMYEPASVVVDGRYPVPAITRSQEQESLPVTPR